MFENLNLRYQHHFVRIDQLKRYVILGKITPQEFQQITSEAYSN